MKERTVLENHIVDKFKIWEYIWTNRNLGFVITKNQHNCLKTPCVIKQIKWFLKNNYVKKKKKGKDVYYIPNMRNKHVKTMINALSSTIHEEIKIL